jgi:hypothetical protein
MGRDRARTHYVEGGKREEMVVVVVGRKETSEWLTFLVV